MKGFDNRKVMWKSFVMFFQDKNKHVLSNTVNAFSFIVFLFFSNILVHLLFSSVMHLLEVRYVFMSVWNDLKVWYCDQLEYDAQFFMVTKSASAFCL